MSTLNQHWQSAYVEANGIRIHYTRTGGNLPPLVLAHGITDNGACWTPVAAALQADYDIIMPDARGHGLTDAPESGYALPTLGDDLAGLITALGLTKPIILGHSLGAATALVLASTYPDLPRAILLEDPPDFWTAIPERNDLAVWITSLKTKTYAELLDECRASEPHWSEAEIVPWAESKVQVNLNTRQMVTPDALRYDWANAVPRITCPVLLIPADPALGAAIHPPAIAALKGWLPQMEITPIAGAGHSIHRDQFDAYMAVVREFLARQGV